MLHQRVYGLALGWEVHRQLQPSARGTGAGLRRHRQPAARQPARDLLPRLHYVIGLARNSRLEEQVQYAQAMLADQFESTGVEQRWVSEFD